MIDFFHNVALLTTLCVAYRYIAGRFGPTQWRGKTFLGLIFGAMAILAMMSPWTLLPGIVFDSRSVIIALAGLFGGWIAGALAALSAMVYRLILGGEGALTGVGVIFTSALLGALFRTLHRGRNDRKNTFSPAYLFLLGVVVHLTMLGWMFTLPEGRGIEVLRSVSLPIMLVLPLSTLLIGLILVDQDDQNRAKTQLRESEARFQKLFREMAQGVIYMDRDGAVRSANPAAQRLLGLTADHADDGPRSTSEWTTVHEDGTAFAPSDYPSVVAMREGRSVRGVIMGIRDPETRSLNWLQIHATPLFRPGESEAYEAFTTFEDVTQIREQEAEIRRLNRLYAALSAVNHAVVEGGTQSEVLHNICQGVADAGQFRLVSIGTCDPRTAVLNIVTAFGEDRGYLEEVAIRTDDSPAGQGPCGVSVRKERKDVCNDFFGEDRMAPFQTAARAYGFASLAAFPIHLEKKLWGTLSVYDAEPHFFHEKELKLVEEIAQDVSFALEVTRKDALRRAAEQGLHDNEQRLRLALEGANLGTWDWHVPSGTVTFNKRWAEMLGYSMTELRPHISTLEELSHPEDRAAAKTKLEAHLTGQTKAFESEYRLRHRHGDWIWVLDSGRVLERDASGHPVRVCGIHLDLTERKEAEITLRREQEFSRTLLENLEDGVVACDAEGRLSLFNQTARNWHSLDTLDLAQEQWATQYKLFAPDGETPLATGEIPLVRAFRGESLRDVGMSILADGQPLRHILATGGPFSDAQGQKLGAVVIMRDITEKRRAEEHLRTMHERLRYHVQNSPLAIVEWDRDFRVKQWSQRAEQLFGWPEAELLGKSPAEWPFVPPEDQADVALIMSDLTEGRVLRNVSVNRNLTKGGRILHAEWYNSVLRGPDQQLDSILSLVHDVTERVEALQEVERTGSQLRALSGRLQTLREEERTRISREIHDELGQMLTCIRMDLSWIEHQLDAFGDDHRVNPILDRLLAAAELTQTTATTVQRIAADLRPGILDRLGLINTLEFEADRFEQQTGMPCRLTLPEDQPLLAPEISTAFFRIFQEALTNVKRHAQASEVKVRLHSDGSNCFLEVHDNGRGIDPDAARNSASLGLLGMRERAYLLGGTAEVAPGPQGGTLVTVRLPSKAPSPPAHD